MDENLTPSQRWEKTERELRTCRQFQSASWGEINNVTLGRFVAGDCNEKERDVIQNSLAQHPDLADVVDLVNDVLTKQDPEAAENCILAPSPLHITSFSHPESENATESRLTIPSEVASSTGAVWLRFNGPRVLVMVGISGGLALICLLILMLIPSHDRTAYLALNKEIAELKEVLRGIEQEQIRLEAEHRQHQKAMCEIEERKQEIMDLYIKSAKSFHNLKRQRAELNEEFRKLEYISNLEKRRQAKAKLDIQRAELLEREAEKKAILAQFEAQKRKIEDEVMHLTEDERLRLKNEQSLLELQQQNAALNASIINASRPHYSPWHPYLYWP